MSNTRFSTHAGARVNFYVLDCPTVTCGVLFAITEEMEDRRRKDGKNFYCPNGHHMSWTPGKSDATKLKEAQARETALRDQLRASTREAENTRVQLVRDRSRIAKGICPCCNRHFPNVERHMTTEHPDYANDHGTALVVPGFECSCGRIFDTFLGLRIHQGKARPTDWDETSTIRPRRAHTTVAGS